MSRDIFGLALGADQGTLCPLATAEACRESMTLRGWIRCQRAALGRNAGNGFSAAR
jgi:hypothetical protein